MSYTQKPWTVEKIPVYGTPGFTWEPFEAYLRGHCLHHWLECLTLLREENARLKSHNAELLEAATELNAELNRRNSYDCQLKTSQVLSGSWPAIKRAIARSEQKSGA